MTPRESEPPDASTGFLSTILDRGRLLANRMISGVKGTYIFWGLVVFISFCFLWSAFSGPHGILSLAKQKKDAQRLETDNKVLLQQNQALKKEVYLLKTNPETIRKTAREELGYIDKGEKLYLSPGESSPPISESSQ